MKNPESHITYMFYYVFFLITFIVVGSCFIFFESIISIDKRYISIVKLKHLTNYESSLIRKALRLALGLH